MKESLLKDSIRQIKNTFKRFLSIVMIVLLGVGFFAGLKATSPDMKDTVDTYYDKQDVMDIEVISTLGLTDGDIEALKNVEGIKNVVATYSFDAILNNGEKEFVLKIESMPEELNKLELIEGKMPQDSTECVVEEDFLKGTKYKIGDYVTVNPEEIETSLTKVENIEENSENNESSSIVKENKLKIVGTIKSPLYISRSRGTSKLGAGSVNYYMFMPKENINMNVYTIAYVSVEDAKNLKTYEDDYNDKVEKVLNNIKEISEERKQIRYNEIIDSATEKLEEAQNKYDSQKQEVETELNNARTKIDEAKQQIENSEKELASNKSKAQTQFSQAQQELNNAETQIEEGKKNLESKKSEVNDAVAEMQSNLENLQSIKSQYDTLKEQKSDLEKQIAEIEDMLAELNKNPEENQDKIAELTTSKNVLLLSLEKINQAIGKIEGQLQQQGIEANNLQVTIATIENGIDTAKKEIQDAESKILVSEKEVQNNKEKLKAQKTSTEKQLQLAEQKLENAKNEISENEKTLEEKQKEAQTKLEEAQTKLNDAKTQISKVEKPTWYVLDRNSNYGYAEYMQDTDRIANLAKVFPVVFFLVAALISLTSMSRMIEEQRVQIGTLKALGYNKLQISMKYLIYAFLATIIGGIAGMLIGFKVIPSIVTTMYGMMYPLPKADCTVRLDIGFIGIIFALICTIGATVYTCAKELKERPATLMLPKAPKPGKRILLERVTFIWKRMKFTQKVTARNLFRYKKKFLMTIIGVAGCTSLIIAGFGIRNAISNMIPNQYGEIFKYDGSIELKDDITNSQIKEENEKIKSFEKIDNTLTCYEKTVEITSIQNSQTINLLVTDDVDNLDNFISLKSRTKKNEHYKLGNNSVVLSEKLAKLLDIKVGDIIKIKNTDNIEKNVKVGAITENYIYHYMYMSSEEYNSLYGENSYKPNAILIKEVEQTSEDDEDAIGKEILNDKEIVSGVNFLSMTKDIFAMVMDKMELVVYILIVSAGLLAFAVLYNLSNVNISERIRELATIKVLGFYDNEVFNYVIKETRILTAIGIILGLFGGYALSMYAIKTCELDMLMFNYDFGTMCYVYGIIITIVFAEIINIAVNHTLKKISMIDSLKSVD